MIFGTSLLVGFALLLSAGGASAQTSAGTQASQTTGFSQTVDIPEENVFAALVLDDSVDIRDIANIQRSVDLGQSISSDSDLDREDTLLLLALDNNGFGSSSLFGGGFGGFDDDGFLFGGDFDSTRNLRSFTDQRVSIDEDDVLLALALDGSTDFDDIADISLQQNLSREASRDSDLDRNDVLLLLALDNRGVGSGFDGFGVRSFGVSDFDDLDDFDDFDRLDRFGGIGTFGGIGGFGLSSFDDDFGLLGDVDSTSAVSRSVSQSVDLDEDDVFAALVLGNSGFGGFGLGSVADIERTTTTSVVADRDLDLDREDVLLALALD